MMTKRDKKRMRDACDELHKNDKPFRKAANADFIIYLLTVVLIALSIRTFIFEPVEVIGGSMIPTLLDGEGMFVEKLTYAFNQPERSDIVICRYPYYTLKCVKRVIGVPGDRIKIEDGAVYLNGELLDESLYWRDYIEGDMPELTVPENSFFVMGDNRNYSGDSREVGCIPYSQIKGKVRGVIVPFANARVM